MEKAEPQFRRALELEPNAWANHSHMGVLRLYQGRFDEAESEFKAGLALAPENARLWSNLGGLYMLMKREADAEHALARAVGIKTPIRGCGVESGTSVATGSGR